MKVQVMVVLTVTRCVLGQRDLPSPPKIVYGGFVPIIMDNQFSENIHIQHKLRRDRTSKSLSFYTDKLSNSETQQGYKFSPPDVGQGGGDHQYVRPQPHVNSKPRFPLFIPEKHRFHSRDAIKGNQARDNALASQLISPKFFDFLPSLQQLPMLFGFESPVKRPPKPPASHSSSFPVHKPGKPSGILNVPTSGSVPQTRPEDALEFFNAGLDNFIQNPATLTQVPQPANSGGNSNAPLVLPPGMSIEQKTEFLSNLDPKHQSFISMPHTNAGILPLHQKEPLDLYPPLNSNKINIFKR